MSIDMKKPLTIISYSMIRPADETPRKTLWLSRLDMMRRNPYSHIPALYVYAPTKFENNNTPSSTTFFDTKVLKESLARALVSFYPMAGRLQINKNTGRYEIDCNGEGVLFGEAETTHTLADLGCETDPNIALGHELFSTCDYSKGLSSIPLLMVQLTRFKCGGVCLGFSLHHHVVDGTAQADFISSWGRLAKGLDIAFKPVHDRFNYVAPRDPPQVDLLDLHFMEPFLPPSGMPGTTASTITGTFKLSESQIKVLKQDAISSQELSSYQVTTFTVVAGHVWRSVCKARNLAEDQDVKLFIPIDGRQSLNLPLGYMGNVIMYATGKAKARDMMQKPLWYAISKVCEAVQKMKYPESFRSAIDYFETQPSFEPLVRGESTCINPNLYLNTWTKIAAKESDFGWGAPKFIRHGGGPRCEGQSGLLPGENGDGSLLLSIRLFTHHMALFEKYLYEV